MSEPTLQWHGDNWAGALKRAGKIGGSVVYSKGPEGTFGFYSNPDADGDFIRTWETLCYENGRVTPEGRALLNRLHGAK